MIFKLTLYLRCSSCIKTLECALCKYNFHKGEINMMSNEPTSLSYQDAGVDIAAGNALVERIKATAKKTQRAGVMGSLGGFGALFELPKGYQEPVLVSGTDGVGTKLKLAMELDAHDSIGIDLVAMCVNDLIVAGAEPLYFLDYYATGKLNVDIAAQVVAGIGEGCLQAGAALTGGETAEMPGMYAGSDYDLAGFCVGIVEKSKLIDGSKVQAGNKIIALASSGAHSNGYSLIRKIIDHAQADLQQPLGEQTLAQAIMAPTKIYVKPILELLKKHSVNALVHVTGGGFQENIPRILPPNTKACIDTKSWQWPALFNWLQAQGNVAEAEMYRTFNCGVGMLLLVTAEQAEDCLALLSAQGEKAWLIGDVQEASKTEAQVEFID